MRRARWVKAASVVMGLSAQRAEASRTAVAATFSLDRTGSPLASGQSCGSCHSGSSNNAQAVVRVLDGMGALVTEYSPGQTYAVEVDINSSFGFARGM